MVQHRRDRFAGSHPVLDQLTEGGAGGCVYGAGEGWSSGDDTAINRRGALRLRWDGQAKADTPALGRYNDTIVIELEVRS